MFVVKVQRPVATNIPGGGLAMIYNRDRSVETLQPMSDELRNAMGDEYKQFWYAYFRGTVLHLDRQAPWQEW